MELNREILNHFNCDKCQQWWSIASADFPLGHKLYCPWCGYENIIDEINSDGNVVSLLDEVDDMSGEAIEQRILKHWKEWWADKHNPPVDRLLLQLIAMALEEMESILITLAAEIKQSRADSASVTKNPTTGISLEISKRYTNCPICHSVLWLCISKDDKTCWCDICQEIVEINPDLQDGRSEE